MFETDLESRGIHYIKELAPSLLESREYGTRYFFTELGNWLLGRGWWVPANHNSSTPTLLPGEHPTLDLDTNQGNQNITRIEIQTRDFGDLEGNFNLGPDDSGVGGFNDSDSD